MAGGVEYQVTKVDPTNPETKGMVYQVNSVSEEVAATLGGKVYRARFIKDPTDPTVAGKVYQIVLIGDPSDPAVKGKVYNAILTGGSEVVVVGPTMSPLLLPDAVADSLTYVKAFGGTEQRNLPDGYIERQFIYMMDGSYLLTDIVPTYDGRYELDMQTTNIANSPATYLGCVQSTGTSQGLRFAHITSGAVRVVGFGSYSDSAGGTTTANTRYKFVWNNNVATVTTGETTVLSNTFSDNQTVEFPLAINAYNIAGTISGNLEGIYLYGFKAWDNQGNLIADYVPAIQKGTVPVVGFYDTVSKTFKTATAGTFTAGANAVPSPETPMDIVSNNGALKLSPNLWNPNATSNYWINTEGNLIENANSRMVRVPANPDDVFTLSATYSEKSDRNIIVVSFRDSSDNNLSRRAVSSNTSLSVTSTAPAGTKSVCFARFTETPTTIQAESGSTATPYIPYGVICADGTVETINAHGKNLFDIDSCIANTYINSEGATNASASWKCSGFIPVSPNTGYVFTVDTTSGASAKHCFYAQAQTESFISYIDSGSQTFTTPPNARYMRISVRKESAQAQLELGTTATTYAPYYDGGTATAEMLLKVGDYQDVQSIIDGAVMRNVGVKVLDGTENWFAYASGAGYQTTVQDMPPSNSGAYFCTHAIAVSAIYSKGIRFGANNKTIYWCQINTTFTTLDIFKAWLADQYAAGTPVIVIYPLATPTTETVTGQTMQVQQGDNVVEITQASLDNLELEAEYEKESA